MNEVQRTIVMFCDGRFLRPENGAQAHTVDTLRFLSTHFSDVVVYAIENHPTHPWRPEDVELFSSTFPGVAFHMDRSNGFVRGMTRLKNALISLFPALAPRLLRWRVPGVMPKYAEICRRHDDYVCLVHFVDALTILNGFPFEHGVVDTHDVKFLKYSRLFRRPPFQMRVLGKLRGEAAMLDCVKAIVVNSPVDATILQTFARNPETYYVPVYSENFHLPEGGEAAAGRSGERQKFDLLFVGADNRFNVDGMIGFLASHAEIVRDRRIAIAGAMCANERLQAAAKPHEKTTLLGFVEDLSPIYAQSKAVLSPVDGTGLKIKVMQALGHGKPVLASQHAIDGLPRGCENCVFPLDESWINTILDDEAIRRRAEAAARAYYSTLQRAGDLQLFLEFLRKECGSGGVAPQTEPSQMVAG